MGVFLNRMQSQSAQAPTFARLEKRIGNFGTLFECLFLPFTYLKYYSFTNTPDAFDLYLKQHLEGPGIFQSNSKLGAPGHEHWRLREVRSGAVVTIRPCVPMCLNFEVSGRVNILHIHSGAYSRTGKRPKENFDSGCNYALLLRCDFTCITLGE